MTPIPNDEPINERNEAMKRSKLLEYGLAVLTASAALLCPVAPA